MQVPHCYFKSMKLFQEINNFSIRKIIFKVLLYDIYLGLFVIKIRDFKIISNSNNYSKYKLLQLFFLPIRVLKSVNTERHNQPRRVTRRGGEVYPALFQKLKKSALNLEKIACGHCGLIVAIYELNFLFKMQFSRVSRRKNRRFFPAGPFFLVLYLIVLP